MRLLIVYDALFLALVEMSLGTSTAVLTRDAGAFLIYLNSLTCPVSDGDRKIALDQLEKVAPALSASEVTQVLAAAVDVNMQVDGVPCERLLEAFERTASTMTASETSRTLYGLARLNMGSVGMAPKQLQAVVRCIERTSLSMDKFEIANVLGGLCKIMKLSSIKVNVTSMRKYLNDLKDFYKSVSPLPRFMKAIERTAPSMNAREASRSVNDLQRISDEKGYSSLAIVIEGVSLTRLLEAVERTAPDMSAAETSAAIKGLPNSLPASWSGVESALLVRVHARLSEAIERTAPDMAKSDTVIAVGHEYTRALHWAPVHTCLLEATERNSNPYMNTRDQSQTLGTLLRVKGAPLARLLENLDRIDFDPDQGDVVDVIYAIAVCATEDDVGFQGMRIDRILQAVATSWTTICSNEEDGLDVIDTVVSIGVKVEGPLITRLLEHMDENLGEDLVQTVKALSLLGDLDATIEESQLTKLLDYLKTMSETMSVGESSEPADVLYGLGRLGVFDDEVYTRILDDMGRHADDMDADDISKTLFGLAEYYGIYVESLPNAELGASLIEAAERNVDDMDAKQTARLVHGLLGQGYFTTDGSLFDRLMSAVNRTASDMNAGDASHALETLILYSDSNDEHPGRNQIALLMDAVGRTAHKMSGKDVVRVAKWMSLGKVAEDTLPMRLLEAFYRAEEFYIDVYVLSAMERTVLSAVDDSAGLANFIYFLARFDVSYNFKISVDVLVAVAKMLPSMDATSVSKVLFGLGSMKGYGLTVEQLTRPIDLSAPKWSAAEVAQSLYGLSRLHNFTQEFLRNHLLQTAIERTAPEMNADNLQQTLSVLGSVKNMRLEGTLLTRLMEALTRTKLPAKSLNGLDIVGGEKLGVFTVHSHAGGSLIEIDRRFYTHAVPDRDAPHHHLPSQTLGTCYIFAALNAVVNETVFVKGLLQFLKGELDRSAYGRKPSESPAEADQRRFGHRVAARITMSEDLGDVDEDAMRQVFDSISTNKEIFMWARNVILYNTLKASLDRQERVSGKPFASRTSLFMKDWSIDRDVQNKFDAALNQIDGGGSGYDVLEDIFTLSGLKTLVVGESLLATIPRSGETLCVGDYPTDAPPRVDGSYTGMHSMKFKKGSGHVNAFTRKFVDSDPMVIESNTGKAQTVADNLAWWSSKGEEKYACVHQWWTSAFTCIRDDIHVRPRGRAGGAPASTPNASYDDSYAIDAVKNTVENIVVNAIEKRNGIGTGAILAAYQAAAIAPGDARTLAQCDAEKCEMDNDLRAALFAIKAFVAHEASSSPAGGGSEGSSARSPWPITMLALSAVTAVLTACVH